MKRDNLPSFSQLKNEVISIKRSHEMERGYTTSPVETSIITQFFKMYHPEWYQKTNGSVVVDYTIEADPSYKTCHFVLHTIDGYSTDIGYGKLRAKQPDIISYKLGNIKAACRTAIDGEIEKMRIATIQRIRDGVSIVSELDNTRPILIGNFQIDHYNKTFDEIAFDWIMKKGFDFLFDRINMGEENSCTTQFTDQSLSEEFLRYHNSGVTHLRIITREENMSILRIDSMHEHIKQVEIIKEQVKHNNRKLHEQ